MALRDWMQLTLTAGLGGVLCRRVVEAAGNSSAACNLAESQLRSIEGIGTTRASRLHRAMNEAISEAEIELQRARAIDVNLICPDDSDYPLLLREIPDPPCVLYLKGSIQPRDLHGVAIVGSRKCSFYGREQAERFGALLGGAGVTVLSGGARGIDSAAHRGAMSHPAGRTIAVLGCGIDVVYPPENSSLFEQIAQHGAVISEYPIGTPPRAENFPRRNRIVSGMSRGVLVIEAGEKSGALITARQALDDHGRPVFALPGRVDNELSAGPHKFIKDGAILTTGLEDILDNLMPLPDAANKLEAPSSQILIEPALQPQSTPSTLQNLSERQSAIISHIDRDVTSVDTIIELSNLPAAIVLQELTMLTLKGVVRRADQGYCRK